MNTFEQVNITGSKTIRTAEFVRRAESRG